MLTARTAVRAPTHTLQCRINPSAVRVSRLGVQVVLFQVLYQAKLMLTALLSVFFLGRQLTTRKWLALGTLTMGVVAVELSDASSSAPRHASAKRHALLGIFAVLLAATLSSTAGVYFEAIVKTVEAHPPSLWVRNVQLCVFTIPIAAITVVANWKHAGVSTGPAFEALDATTTLLIILNASGGLIVAAALKYGDSILKNFVTAFSVILGTIISVFLFDFQLSLQFAAGALLVIASGYAYAIEPGSAAAGKPTTGPAGSKEEEKSIMLDTEEAASGASDDEWRSCNPKLYAAGAIRP